MKICKYPNNNNDTHFDLFHSEFSGNHIIAYNL
jgi:hypothetical protein